MRRKGSGPRGREHRGDVGWHGRTMPQKEMEFVTGERNFHSEEDRQHVG